MFGNKCSWRVGWIALCCVVVCPFGIAADAAREQLDFFEKKIRPLLIERCHECHSGDAEESGLRLDSWEAIAKGGERGPAVLPGKPEESLLVSAVRHGELLKMPPKRKLSSTEIADLERWVTMGAPWPGTSRSEPPPVAGVRSTTFSESQRSHWAFQPPAGNSLPSVSDWTWVQSPIDAFVLEKLAAHGLSPAPAATRATLIRRMTFDLTGIPPTLAEVNAFVKDDSPDAIARLVDRLLSSALYGERWGRHWLDVARYADSNGLDENLAYANAYRYRDYVIDAWNGDKPFDVFLREQIAGDLAPSAGTDDADRQQLVATGFLSLGAKMLAEDDPVKMHLDIIDEQLDTLGRAFLGMTWGCARCHDHKFDPISTADYYALAGIFKSTRTMETHTVVARWLERPLASAEAVKARDEHLAKVQDVDRQISEILSTATRGLLNDARRHAGDYLLAAYVAERMEHFQRQAQPRGGRDHPASQPAVIVIEAENFVRGNVLRDSETYGRGIGVLVNQGNVPNFAEYEVDVSGEGLYQVEIRHAAASARPTQLWINGDLVKPDAAASVTGSWNPDGQQWHIEGYFRMNPGKNVIRLEQPQFFPHIDKLLIAPAPPEIIYLASEPLSRAFRPVPEITRRWRDLLAQTRDAEHSILSVWHAFTREGEFFAPQAIDSDDPFGLFSDSTPADIVELAECYERRFQRTIEEWETTIANNKSANKLDTAADEAFRSFLYDDIGPFTAPKTIEQYFPPTTVSQLQQLRDQKKAVTAAVPVLPEAMSVRDDTPQDLRIHIRGSHLSLGAVAPRGLPQVFAVNGSPGLSSAQSGRLELAQWIASPRNPLTARVLVNRVWQWHFGEGLVRTPDNFGLLGESPTHPELLDWLAERFVASGWSIKELHRLILLSSTYQMNGQAHAIALEKDPDNRLLWRFQRRRLDAESVRDAILAVTDQLDFRMGGSLLPTLNRQYVTSTASVDPVVYESRRRSVYLPVVRSALYDVFQTFDFADPSVSQGKRETTTIAPQALFMMNSKFVSAQTRSLAETLLADVSLADAARVDQVFQRILGRPPTDAERARALEYVHSIEPSANTSEKEFAQQRLQRWQSLCRAVLSSNEFIYVP